LIPAPPQGRKVALQSRHLLRHEDEKLRKSVDRPNLVLGINAKVCRHEYVRAQIWSGLSGRWLDGWREAADLHPDPIFQADYPGGGMPTLAINFSRPGLIPAGNGAGFHH
jgi:hypothetical protein